MNTKCTDVDGDERYARHNTKDNRNAEINDGQRRMKKLLTNGTRTTTTLRLLISERKICMETLSLLFFQLTNNEEITNIPACTPS